MSNKALKEILELSCEARYEYFLDLVGDEREVWILINSQEHFLKLHAEDQGGFEYLPIWPNTEFAEDYASATADTIENSDLKPKSISLPQFLNKWLPGLDKDGIEVGVFPGSDKSVWITEPSELEKDLREELSRF